MIRRRLNRIYFCLRVTTFLLPTLAFGAAAYIRFGLNLFPTAASSIDPIPYFGLLLLATVVWAIVSEYLGLCTIEQLFAPGGKTRRVVMACLITYAVLLVTAFFYRATSFSRLFITLSAVALVLLMIATRLVFRVVWHHQRRDPNNWIKLLFVGADEFAQRVAHSLTSGQVAPCRVVGYIRLPGQTVAEVSAPVHELRDIGKLTSGNGFDEVIIAVPLSLFAEIPRLMAMLESLCVPVRAALDFGEDVVIRERLFDLGGTLMVDLHTTPAELVTYSILKRAFDLAFSSGVLIVTAPLMALIGALIKLTSAGPILFVQERVGLNGKIFRKKVNQSKNRTEFIAKVFETDALNMFMRLEAMKGSTNVVLARLP